MFRTFAVSVIALTACTRDPATSSAPAVEHRTDAVFVNGDFESGSFTGWSLATFTNKGIIYPPTSRANLQLQAGGTNLTKIISAASPETIIPAGLSSAGRCVCPSTAPRPPS